MPRGAFVYEMEAAHGNSAVSLGAQVSPLKLAEAPQHVHTGRDCGPGPG